jgi:hypothetical protein
MSNRSKGRGQTKCSPWSCRLGIGLTTPPRKKLLLRNHGGHQDLHGVVATIEKKKKKKKKKKKTWPWYSFIRHTNLRPNYIKI